MKDIGEFLKNTRIHNGVSIEEASEDLNLSILELENLEEGNVRAFKDIYMLKELVREYGKYLGLETDKIIDEFNDFMFEHTSKISLDDIKEARKIAKDMDEKPRVVSPYTYTPKKKFSLKNVNWKKFGFCCGIVLLVLITIMIIKTVNHKSESVSSELMGRISDVYNEFSY